MRFYPRWDLWQSGKTGTEKPEAGKWTHEPAALRDMSESLFLATAAEQNSAAKYRIAVQPMRRSKALAWPLTSPAIDGEETIGD